MKRFFQPEIKPFEESQSVSVSCSHISAGDDDRPLDLCSGGRLVPRLPETCPRWENMSVSPEPKETNTQKLELLLVKTQESQVRGKSERRTGQKPTNRIVDESQTQRTNLCKFIHVSISTSFCSDVQTLNPWNLSTL